MQLIREKKSETLSEITNEAIEEDSDESTSKASNYSKSISSKNLSRIPSTKPVTSTNMAVTAKKNVIQKKLS